LAVVVTPPPQVSRTFRFGEFEFAVRAVELRKNGEIVRLQQQPLKVLHALLHYAGGVVTRSEIRERVWPDASIQDFDNSLRVAITKLRQALGDDSDDPKYIETLPRRGYRWLYPVTVHDSPIRDANDRNHTEPGNGGRVVERDEHEVRLGRPRPGRVTFKSVVYTLILLLAALGVGRYLRARPDAGESRVVPLTTYPGLEYMPAFSADGKRVAFAWTGPNTSDPYRVYFKLMGDDRPRRLTEAPADASDSDPVWGPDGVSIYFFRRGAGQTGIYVASTESGAARLVHATSLGDRRVRRSRFDVSPNGKLLAYVDAVNGKETVALFLLDLETMQSRQISEPPSNAEGDGDPAFSHDGKRIAFLRNLLDLQQLIIAPVEGGEARMVVSDFIADFFDGLAWTADDREIIIGGKQLRRVSTAGGDRPLETVSYAPGPALFPAIRGDRLAYVQTQMNANIWKLDLRDTVHAVGQPERLISSTRQEAAASFSPDSSRIAFQSDRTGSWEIWVCNRDSSDPVQLTHFGGPMAGTPRWSPDGQQIVFDSRASGVSQIYAIAADGGDPRRLTFDSAGGEVPFWSRDGKWIYYSSIRDGLANVWKLPAQGGTPIPVTSKGGIYAAESVDGRHLYYSRNSHDPTIWRLPLAGGNEEAVAGAPMPFDCTHWALTDAGIYAIDGNGELQFYGFNNGHVIKVFRDQRFLTDWSMAVSPDGRQIVWAQIDESAADLTLIENFR
jgi:Tol biopolymer transport system component/DNA-binding winged helix-turn-helix (wHTH) protein